MLSVDHIFILSICFVNIYQKKVRGQHPQPLPWKEKKAKATMLGVIRDQARDVFWPKSMYEGVEMAPHYLTLLSAQGKGSRGGRLGGKRQSKQSGSRGGSQSSNQS